MKKLFSILLLTALSIASYATEKTVSLRFIETSDVHGSFFPYDFTNRKPRQGSMEAVMLNNCVNNMAITLSCLTMATSCKANLPAISTTM